ncbi:MAG: hypothetical protein UT05_C0002G0093 [Parcubacteria group bacterium GW2011_GWF2_38_76]|nr:MAG: hypothetical protein UT05_C0002G0093 [Parcubacteria group bacterium GW2011_GWF2_38_76]HBM45749.1 hypothetical protein [Patescibacteria group bacterium]
MMELLLELFLFAMVVWFQIFGFLLIIGNIIGNSSKPAKEFALWTLYQFKRPLWFIRNIWK